MTKRIKSIRQNYISVHTCSCHSGRAALNLKVSDRIGGYSPKKKKKKEERNNNEREKETSSIGTEMKHGGGKLSTFLLCVFCNVYVC